MRFKLIFFVVFFINISVFAQVPVKFQELIDKGEFTEAQQAMRMELATNLDLTSEIRQSIAFEIERLERIKKDFSKTKMEVVEYIKLYIPNVTENNLARCEQEKSLEYMIIDGQKRYFHNAAPNLFRIDKKAKEIKQKKETNTPPLPGAYDRLKDVQQIVKLGETSGKQFIHPVRFRITYTLTVKPNITPAGKVIRCWLPYPREIPQRQTDVQFLSSEPERHIIAANEDYLQRTIYLEKIAVEGKETRFQVVFEYTGHAVYHEIKADLVKPAQITPELVPFIEERPPHIVFAPELKALSIEIIGTEDNPYRIAQKIFKWIDDNIPWASAREYSTFENISDYVYRNRYGDCGMQTILFMTLCRLNGIPTRWQSGWTTEPGDEGMHDWGEIYFEPYGWIPVDVTYGLMSSQNDQVKWFFLGGMDTYRLIVNDDYAQNLYPAKIHFRSETIDFQRGEVEWEGGNLYFDQWDYDFDVERINEN